MKILLTGGAGFIGSNLVDLLLEERFRSLVDQLIVLDNFTYAGSDANLERARSDPRVTVIAGDIGDARLVNQVVANVDAIMHLAAETHVDRSIDDALKFIDSNVRGTYTLLHAARTHNVELFLHVSTDEVYGVPPEGHRSLESDALLPRNPYAASKAAAELICHSFSETYGMKIVIARSSNNVGPRQYVEKLVPRLATNALRGLPFFIHGDGLQQRDWLYVTDNCEALVVLLTQGVPGARYNIGAHQEHSVNDVADVVADEIGIDVPRSYTEDRLGNDRRYSIETKSMLSLGWAPSRDFERAVRETVRWYSENADWWQPVVAAESIERAGPNGLNQLHEGIAEVGAATSSSASRFLLSGVRPDR